MKYLSIVLPMYNVEPYLERCLRSLIKQDIPTSDYEIICVNDGSPDNSREVVLSFQTNYDNLFLIDQENQGVSRARNKGMEKASGKYVLFVDPDDFVDVNSFSRILKNAEKHHAEISFLGFSFLNEDYTIHQQIFNQKFRDMVFTGTEAYKVSRDDGNTDPDRMWAVLFNRAFLEKHNHRFLPDVPYLEDGEFIARTLCVAERCVFDGHSFYQRTTRQGSATNSRLFYSEKASRGFVLAACNLYDFQKNKKLNTKQRQFLNQPIVKFAALSIKSCQGRKYFSRVRRVYYQLKKNGLRKLNLEGCNRIYTLYGNVYNISPYLVMPLAYLYVRFNMVRARVSAVTKRISD